MAFVAYLHTYAEALAVLETDFLERDVI